MQKMSGFRSILEKLQVQLNKCKLMCSNETIKHRISVDIDIRQHALRINRVKQRYSNRNHGTVT